MAKYGKTDVFPRSPTRKVKALIDYPKWGSLVGQRDVKYFCLYMDVGDRIYYQKRTPTDTVISTVYAHGMASKQLKQFRPDVINFAKIYNRYKIPPIETNRVNSDTRTGFKMGSDYLVKAYFTFGQRYVEPGYSHIIQTLNIPILFYLRPRECGDRVKNGLFPTRHLFKYDRRILEPHTRYRVPSGSVYVLFCVQKTFFRLDLADATTEIPFECKDPVMERVVRIKDLYDEPVATPYIEDQNQESTAATYLSFTFPSPPAEGAQVNEIHNFLRPCNQEPGLRPIVEQQHQSFSEQQQQSQPAFEHPSQSFSMQQQQQPFLEQQHSQSSFLEQQHSQSSFLEQQHSQSSFLEQQHSQSSFEQHHSQSSFEQQHSQPAFEQHHSQPAFEQQQSEQQQSQITFEQQSVPFSEQQQSQQAFEQQPVLPTYFLIQNSLSAVRETTIVRINAKEFVSTYRRLAFREFKNPNVKFCVDPTWNPLPLDLTMKKVPLIDLTTVEQVEKDDEETENERPIDLSAKQIDAVELQSMMDQSVNPDQIDAVELQPMINQNANEDQIDFDAIANRPMDQRVSQIFQELEAITQDT